MKNMKKIAVLPVAALLVFGYSSYVSAKNINLEQVIDKYFSELDTYLEKMAQTKAMRSRLATADKYFLDQATKHPEIHTYLRTNSKGRIVNEVIEGDMAERNYRIVSNQGWYSVTVGELKPYYGYLKSGNDYYLFWTKPIIIRRSSGSTRSGGALAVKADLRKCFEKISQKVDTPLLVTVGNQKLYSNEWDDSGISKSITPDINGISDITVKYKVGESHSAEQGDSETGKKGAEQSDKKEAAATKKGAAAKPGASLAGTSPKNGGLPGHIIFPALIVFVAVICFIAATFIGKSIKKRNQQLLEAIEKDDFPTPADSKRIVFTKSGDGPEAVQKKAPPRITSLPTEQAPVPSKRTESNDEVDIAELKEESGTTAQPSAPKQQKAPPVSPPPAQAQAQARRQKPPAQAQSAPMTPDQYQQIKKEIYNEAVGYLKSEFEKEYNSRLMQKLEESRREIEQGLKKGVETYNRELGTLLESMSSILVESENSLAQRNRRLKNVLETIKQRMNQGVR
ncbi:MAG: hypothetical protein GF350_02935 [Chitinivibrionales bacterium]|nr:hypothetical protein [Chitinivibrionales bacterium]